MERVEEILNDSHLALARRFFDLIEAADIDAARECLAPDAVVWYSFTQSEAPRDKVVETLRAMVGRMTDIAYVDRRLQASDEGFVQQHILQGTRQDGVRVAIPVAVIARVENNCIIRIDEYMDSALVAEFRKTLD